ncbi:MAG: hypothetical protein QM673_06515 [Gordonia sp. (in: high G+C Gram-positive bacteria)]
MTFLLAVVGLIAIGFLLWHAFGAPLTGRHEHDADRRASVRGPLGPDDDPEFLSNLNRRPRGRNDEL